MRDLDSGLDLITKEGGLIICRKRFRRTLQLNVYNVYKKEPCVIMIVFFFRRLRSHFIAANQTSDAKPHSTSVRFMFLALACA